jgi:hypothetical protein
MSRIWNSSALRWFALALAGLALAVAVGYAASRVTSQRIGLASEPLKAGESLAPHRGHGDGHGPEDTTIVTTTTQQTISTTSPTTTTSTGDDSGSGDGLSGADDD